ncbi:MAG: DUF2089 family protein [Anaerolineae bacterium]
MRTAPTQCPICKAELTITRLYCPQCDTTIEGRFALSRLLRLSPEQLAFVEMFVRCEGKLTRLQEELNLSYPTVRSRLHDVIRALGYEPGREEPAGLSDEERRRILEDLDAGRISFDEAMALLQKGGRSR